MNTLSLIGPGKVGSAIARRLHEAGYQVTAVVARAQQKAVESCEFIGCCPQVAATDLRRAASADIILFTVPDNAIIPLATQLRQQASLLPEQVLVHCSGLHPAAILTTEKPAQPEVLSLHPLLAFADRQHAYTALSGCPCALEGTPRALKTGQELVTALCGKAFMINAQDKVLYHTAASMTSNFSVTLFACAQQLLEKCGIPAHDSIDLLGPLLKATVTNILALGPKAALTGPIVRGDDGTVSRHLEGLSASCPELLDLYLSAAHQTLQLALSADPAKGPQLQNIKVLLNHCQSTRS